MTTSGPNCPLAALADPKARALAVGMLFVSAYTSAQPVTLSENSLDWLIDFGEALLATDNTLDVLTLKGVANVAAARLDAFVGVARAFCPAILREMDVARGAS